MKVSNLISDSVQNDELSNDDLVQTIELFYKSNR
jgi:hypothetical protein